MKVRTELKAGQDVAVAVGAAAFNISKIHQSNYSSITGSYNAVSQSNTAAAVQSATATNSGAVTATA